MIKQAYQAIVSRIEAAAVKAHRDPSLVRVVAAAKNQGREKIEQAIAAGIPVIAHNYVQEAVTEAPDPALRSRVEVHMIGHLQKNKAGKAVELFDVVQTVDDEDLAAALDRRAASAGKRIGVLLQVNLAREPQKSGIEESAVRDLAERVRSLSNLNLLGLMTMPPFYDEPERARPFFAALRELRDRLIAGGTLAPEMSALSMGMSGDFEVAVEEGATLVRIGTALFGPRW